MGNTPSHILQKMNRNLHLQRDHPLGIIKASIESHFSQLPPCPHGAKPFAMFDSLDPVVTVQQCFDDLLVPPDHQSRTTQDSYYISSDRLLRTHMTSYQTQLLRQGQTSCLFSGDVYRRDEIDSRHYPVFHQMDGVRTWDKTSVPGDCDEAKRAWVMDDLKTTLDSLVVKLFGDVERRWLETTFPFTHPSLEAEIFFKGAWLEVLGCGVIRDDILHATGCGHRIGWAFGLGLERLAMPLFSIPDIRLFWSSDKRFTSQFRASEGAAALKPQHFKPFSKYPPCTKDIAFWLPSEGAAVAFHENNLHEAVRQVAGDLVEEVRLVDKFSPPGGGRSSACYRITFRSMERSLTNDEINALQADIRLTLQRDLKLELR